MAGGGRKRKKGRRKRRKRGSSSSSSASGSPARVSNESEEEKGGHRGVAFFRPEVPGGLPDYECGWHIALFVGTSGYVDIMASVRDQILSTCFMCAILYAAEQDIVRWLATEEPNRHPQIVFDFDTYVTQYEEEVDALLGQDVMFFYRTKDYRPRNALNVFLRDGVRAYSKSKEWLGGQMIKISSFQLHKDMVFSDFENIIASGGSVIGGFPLGPEFKTLEPDEIYEFSPVGTKRKPLGAHMVQFIGTGIDMGREFLVFLNSKKRFGRNGVGKVYFDQIYNGVYTLQCRAPPPPPPSDGPGFIMAGPDDSDDTLGSSGAAPDGNMSSFSGAPGGSNAPSSTGPIKSLCQVGKCKRYDSIPSSCAIEIDGWVPSAPSLPVEVIQNRICASIVKIEWTSKKIEENLPPPPKYLFCDIYGPWKKKDLDEMGTVTRCFGPSNKMNDLHFTNILLKIYDKLGGLNSKLALEHCQMIPFVNKITTLKLRRDLSHGSSGLSDIQSSAGVSKNQHGRKHKQPISSSGQANSSGTMNTTGPFPSLASSAPFRKTISIQLMHHNGSISSPLVVSGAVATGTRESPTDQIVGIDRFLKDGWLGHKVDWFLSHDDSTAFTLQEIYSAGTNAKKVLCFHFSSDGKLLATGGHDMKFGRLLVEPAALRNCNKGVGMLFHSTSPNPDVPNWSTDREKRYRERRKDALKSQAETAFKQKEHKMASQIYCLAICHEERATLYSNRSLCKLLMGDGESALSDALGLRPDWAKACDRQAAALMLLKPQEYEQARDALLDAQKLDPVNAAIEREIGKARELMKNPPVECAY